MAKVNKLKNGKFEADYFNAQGKRRRKSFLTKTDADLYLRKKLVEKTNEINFPERSTLKITFNDIAEKYWEVRGSKTKSAKNWRYMLDVLLTAFGKMEVRNITTEDVQSFYDAKVDGASASTANRYLTLMRSVVNKSLKLRLYRGIDPTIGVEAESNNPSRMKFLSDIEMNNLLSLAKPRTYPLLFTALHTGMRRGELLNLDWQDVNLDTGIIYIWESKSGHPRQVPISQELKDLFLSMNPQAEGKVFNITASTVRTDFEDLRAQAGMPDLHFHDLRHTFASHFMMRNGDIAVLQIILGHSNIAMTNRYAHFSPHYLRGSIQIMNGLIKQPQMQADTIN